MRLNARAWEWIAGALAPVWVGRRLRDVAGVPPHDLLLFFETEPGDSPRGALLVSLHPRAARVVELRRRYTALEFQPGRFESRVRTELAGARLERVRARRDDRALDWHWSTPRGERVLHFEFYGAQAAAFLCDAEERVLAVRTPGRGRGREFPPGSLYLPAPPPAREAENPDPEAIEASLIALQRDAEAERTEGIRAELQRLLERQISRRRTRLAGLEVQLRAACDAPALARQADLLQTVAHAVARGAREVEVPDWYGDPETKLRIPLDPRLDVIQNAEKLYQRSKRLARAKDTAEAELQRGRRELAEAEERLASLQTLTDPAELLRTRKRWTSEGHLPAPPAPRRREAAVESLPYRAFTSADGREIRVGRNARANDRLCFGHARGNDAWLHAANWAGSHVVVPCGKDEELPEQTLLDAACLALHFSAARATSGDVHLTRIKHLRRLRGGSPGQVSLARHRGFFFRSEPERLQRLLRGAREPEADSAPEDGPQGRGASGKGDTRPGGTGRIIALRSSRSAPADTRPWSGGAHPPRSSSGGTTQARPGADSWPRSQNSS